MKSTASSNLSPEQIRDQIARETGVSPADQAQYCFDKAYVWLEHALGTDAHGMEVLPLTPGFWPWWCTYWNSVDQAFIDSRVDFHGRILIQYPGQNCMRSVNSLLQMLDIWESYHDTRFVRGNQAILERGFHGFIKELAQSTK